jgi:F-type H+-transporting ATPase subunit b
MQIISNIALISINETLLIQLISFLLFLFIMNRLMFKPLRIVMAERTERVDKAQKSFIEAKEKIETLNADLAKQELTARKEAAKLMRDLDEQGNRMQ